jgi:hypothetical protein
MTTTTASTPTTAAATAKAGETSAGLHALLHLNPTHAHAQTFVNIFFAEKKLEGSVNLRKFGGKMFPLSFFLLLAATITIKSRKLNH